MRKVKFPLSALAMSAVLACGAPEAAADAVEGQIFAEKVCAECHAVSPQDKMSPNAEAPTFSAIAGNPFWTRTALIVWFQTPHINMPTLILDEDELENVIAYIESLRDGT